MDITKKDFFNRVNIIATNTKKPMFVYIHPVHGELTAYTIINSFNKANPNVNNYNELSGTNITDFITEKWFSVFDNNAFNTEYAEQTFALMEPETIQFPSNWGQWWYITSQ